MVTPPYMPLYVERRFSSARVRRMKWDERGAYVILLAEAWMNGARLENDREAIRALLGIADDSAWKRVERFVLDRCFEPSEDGAWLVNPPQATIYERAVAALEGASAKGRAAANARWAKPEECTGNAHAMPMQCYPKVIEEKKKNPPIVPPLGDGVGRPSEKAKRLGELFETAHLAIRGRGLAATVRPYADLFCERALSAGVPAERIEAALAWLPAAHGGQGVPRIRDPRQLSPDWFEAVWDARERAQAARARAGDGGRGRALAPGQLYETDEELPMAEA